ncbi:MAG: hypothetical protein VYA51_03155 [Planctomycetota bacterium]|nr:hypothetical protein [Planctomycetota bacterium]
MLQKCSPCVAALAIAFSAQAQDPLSVAEALSLKQVVNPQMGDGFVPFVDIRTKWLTTEIPTEFYYVHYCLRTLRWFEHYLKGDGDRRSKARPPLDLDYPR